MHLPITHQAHLPGFDDENEELHAQLADSASQEEEGSQGSKGSGGCARERPPKDIPCPRCQSMNTKFCYYNNYSVNQPRHFCRNCQRYWTVGGTLRNVPVGGGSRKKTRTRSRNDPYYRPGAPGSSPVQGADTTSEHHPGLQTLGSMPELQIHPDAQVGIGFGDQLQEMPLHPSQLSSFLQYALGQNHGMYSQLLDRPFQMSPEEEAELQALYEAQSANSGYLGNATAMMNSGLFMPELEPAHLALMHKAAIWAEAQRLQSLARRQAAQATAWEDRESKPSISSQMQRQSAALEELRNRQSAASLQRRPGFWETALMHSRPNKRPGPHAWDDSKLSTQSPLHGSSTVEEEANNPTSAYTHGYEDGSSWASGLGPHDMYYQ